MNRDIRKQFNELLEGLHTHPSVLQFAKVSEPGHWIYEDGMPKAEFDGRDASNNFVCLDRNKLVQLRAALHEAVSNIETFMEENDIVEYEPIHAEAVHIEHLLDKTLHNTQVKFEA